MAKRTLRYFQSPAFIASDWAARNPFLNQGEIGYLVEGGVVTRAKVGPGYWNDLDFIGGDVYDFSEAVTNPIGDASGVLQGMSSAEILHKMLNPYMAPVISGLGNNGGSGLAYQNIMTKEIGQSLSGSVLVNFAVSQAQNLSGGTPVNITAGGVFSNEGNFALTYPITLTLPSPLTPGGLQTINIQVKLTHQNGQTSPVSTQVQFVPRIMWLTSASSSFADGAAFMAAPNRQFSVSSVFKKNYSINGGGYAWVAIPTMLNPTGLQFTEVSNPNLPMNYSMEDMGVISINNGVGTYNYQLFRSTYSLIYPTTLKIS